MFKYYNPYLWYPNLLYINPIDDKLSQVSGWSFPIYSYYSLKDLV